MLLQCTTSTSLYNGSRKYLVVITNSLTFRDRNLTYWCVFGGRFLCCKYALLWLEIPLDKTGISATPACGERHLVPAINITYDVQVLLRNMFSIQRLV